MALSKGSKKRTKAAKGAPPPVLVLSTKWVVVQLTQLGEREKNISLIVRAVHQILKRRELEVFVPAISQKGLDDSLTTWYSDGYVFVRFSDGIVYNSLQETTYFSTVLSKSAFVDGARKTVYSLLDDKDLDPMRVGMKVMKIGGFSEDNRVKVVKGSYKNLTGKISCVYDGGEVVQVCLSLRSKPMFMDFPASYLEKVDL